MNELWETFGYFQWKYSKDFFALCGGGEYIWIYIHKTQLMIDVQSTMKYGYRNHTPGGMNILEMHGPCGPIRI